jgi:hypothetical protein
MGGNADGEGDKRQNRYRTRIGGKKAKKLFPMKVLAQWDM